LATGDWMKQQENRGIIDLAEFDATVSLWQLTPAEDGRALTLLRQLVDHIILNRPERKPSLLITGYEGKKTLAMCFLRALGIEDIKTIPANLLQPTTGVINFFSGSHADKAFVICDAEYLMNSVKLNVYQAVESRQFNVYNYLKEGEDSFPVDGLIILTAIHKDQVPSPILKHVDYLADIGIYTIEQRLQIIKQRLTYAGVTCKSQDALWTIVKTGKGRLHEIIPFLRICLMRLALEGRSNLRREDIEQVAKMYHRPDTKPPSESIDLAGT
jgi:hypothetical protein